MRSGHIFRIKRLTARRLSGRARMDHRDTGLYFTLLRGGCGARRANGNYGRNGKAYNCRVSIEKFHHLALPRNVV